MADAVVRVIDQRVVVVPFGADLIAPLTIRAEAAAASAEAAAEGLTDLLPTAGMKLVEGTGPAIQRIYQQQAFVSGEDYVWEAVAAAGERRTLSFIAAATTFDMRASFDLIAGTVSLYEASAVAAVATITALGNGEYRCRIAFTPSVSEAPNWQFWISDGPPVSYTGDGASGLFIASPALWHGGVNLFSTTDLSDVAWVKGGLSVTSDARTFGSVREQLASVLGGQPLAGKKWAAIGTSITDQDFYTSVLASTSGMVLTNLGVSGGSLASNTHYGSLDLYDAIASIPSDTQLVTIEAGTNDFGAGAIAAENSALGALGNTTTATFYGALYAAVVAVRAQAPDAKIVFLTPFSSGSALPAYAIGTTNPAGNTLPQFQKAVEDVAAYTGWPLIDVGRKAGIGYFTAADLTSDGLHLNEAGGTLYAKFVYDELLRLHGAGFFL